MHSVNLLILPDFSVAVLLPVDERLYVHFHDGVGVQPLCLVSSSSLSPAAGRLLGGTK